MISKRKWLGGIAAAIGVALALGPAHAQKKYGPGASDTEIKIGNVNPYSGPASAYGSIGKAIASYFRLVNDLGGINGRKINFITLDDGYSPPRTVEQVRRLVEQEQVLLVFQSLGTPGNTAIHKYMNARKVPQLFVATGATKWNDPKGHPWTMGWQPNYQSEARAYAAYILKNHPNAKIGVLYQNDDYGKDYLKGFRDGLGSRASKMIVREVTYEVTDPTVDSQIVTLKGSGADVFFNITTPKFAAQAIRKAHEIDWKPVHFLNNVSSSIDNVLKPAGFEASKGIISSLYLKDASDPQWHNDADYKAWSEWMKRYNPGVSPTDAFYVYGYAVASTLHQVLLQCKDELTRENVMRQAANLKNIKVPMLLPGIHLHTSPTDFAPIEAIQLGRFDGKRYVEFGDVLGQ